MGAFINIKWEDFQEVYGVEFVENDGRYEAPGPVAYAAVEFDDGTVCPLEHHFDMFSSKVLAYLEAGQRSESLKEKLVQFLKIPPDLIELIAGRQ